MSRKNIRKSLAENYNRKLLIEVAYYRYDASNIIDRNFNSVYYENITYEEVYALQSFLVKNMEKHDYLVVSCTSEFKFFVTNDSTWKRSDCERVLIRNVSKVLSDILDRKQELELAKSYKEAKQITNRISSLYNFRDNYQKQMANYFTRAISYVESLTQGLHYTTKQKVFENYLEIGNSSYQDDYEDAKERIEGVESEITSISLKSALNPLIKENFELDEEKYQALRTLMSND